MLMTSMSRAGYRQYGYRLISGLQKHMPGTLLTVYSEDDIVELEDCSSVMLASLRFIPAFTGFLQRHGNNPLVNGRQERPGWKEKDRRDGYSYKFDAGKFCRKVFAIADAARDLHTGTLTWIDADAYPTKTPPPEFFSALFAGGHCAYLGREGTHSECGFLHFKLPEAMPLIQAWESYYANDRFLQENEWHDSYLFDLARAEVPSVFCTNLSPPGTRGHVWFDSPLGQCFDHTKGERKKLGYSPERIRKGL
jgi:hypothetical protein